ncbi:MAG: hypothetical protein H2069_07450 [Legionella sp.]|nr:hypothetical protein [Legionella sp.]
MLNQEERRNLLKRLLLMTGLLIGSLIMAELGFYLEIKPLAVAGSILIIDILLYTLREHCLSQLTEIVVEDMEYVNQIRPGSFSTSLMRQIHPRYQSANEGNQAPLMINQDDLEIYHNNSQLLQQDNLNSEQVLQINQQPIQQTNLHFSTSSTIIANQRFFAPGTSNQSTHAQINHDPSVQPKSQISNEQDQLASYNIL